MPDTPTAKPKKATKPKAQQLVKLPAMDLPTLFARAIATGATQEEAYRLTHPETSPATCKAHAHEWATQHANLIEKFRSAAREVALIAHGVDAAWLISQWKLIWETDVRKLPENSPLCQSYQVMSHTIVQENGQTHTTTKTRVWMPSKAEALKQIGALIGAYPDKNSDPPPPPNNERLDDILNNLIKPGSPIARYHREQQGKTLDADTGKEIQTPENPKT